MQDVIKVFILGQQGQFDMHPSPEPCAQVAGAGEDITQVLVPHEGVLVLLDGLLHLVEAVTETLEHP